ncbi:uncharacterized protein LOC132314988 [Cornus florida]|uniref:uncharacterized protein LOC132314988 n=1 Tax=Cornus florida TaxID=4283 RepID=UPI0028A16690|nr:uncharacterized protein LOC132314988 [Cornus florida]
MKRVLIPLIIMSTIYSLLMLFLCLPMHACSAQSLEVLDKRGFGRKVLFQGKVAEKFKLNMDSTKKGAQNEDMISIGMGHDSAIRPKELKVLHKDMKYTKEVTSEMEHAGSEIVKSSPDHVTLLKETKMKGTSRWEARSVLEFGVHEKDDEAIYTTNKSAHEDLVGTDYEPPQRKPPIHNKKT